MPTFFDGVEYEDHFYDEEFTFSQTAMNNGWDNTPHGEAVNNLIEVRARLNVIRSLMGPMKITSGFRSLPVNKAVGGNVRSLHMRGLAVDVRYLDYHYSRSQSDIIRLLLEKLAAEGLSSEKLGISKIIDEYDSWIHKTFSSSREGVELTKLVKAFRVEGKTYYDAIPL